MKRKLFTLLAAFVALVAFQTKAQDTWYWIDTKSPTDNSIPGFSGVTVFPTNIPDAELNGTLQVPAGEAAFKNAKSGSHLSCVMGDYTRYFKITRVGATWSYTILSKQTNNFLELEYAGVKHLTFEFLQFTGGGTGGACFDPIDGGYICMPGGGISGGITVRVFVVVNSLTGALSLMEYPDIATANLAAAADPTLPYFSPLWVKTYAIGGRWATLDDFKNTDFVQFNMGGTNLYAKDNFSNKSYDVFSVQAVGYVQSASINTSETIPDAPNYVNMPGSGGLVNDPLHALWYASGLIGRWDNVTEGFTGTRTGLTGLQNVGSGTNSNWVIPLFTLRTPDDSCKYLSIKKENPLYHSDEAVETAYADRLEIRNYGEYYDQSNANRAYWGYYRTPNLPTTGFLNQFTYSGGPVHEAEVKKAVLSQTYAIWIDVDGNMSIFPAGAYTYQIYTVHYNKPVDFALNYGLLVNTYDVSYDGGPDGLSFKIGKEDPDYKPLGPDFCLAPVERFGPNYLNGLFTEQSATEYNTLQEGRYYFLEAQSVTPISQYRDHVLSVQPVWDPNTNNTFKKAVLIPKEKLLTATGQIVSDYSSYPLDSVIMSAHWAIQKIKDGNEVIGFRFVNELGDTLQYNPEIANLGSGGNGWVGNELYGYDPANIVALAGGVSNYYHTIFPNWVYGWGGQGSILPPVAPNPNNVFWNPFALNYNDTTAAHLGSAYWPQHNVGLAPRPDDNPLVSTSYDATTGLYYDAWTSIKRKGAEGDFYYLRLNYYGTPAAALTPTDWAYYQINLDTLQDYSVTTYPTSPASITDIYTPGWYHHKRVANITNAAPGWYYAQRDVVAQARDIHTYPNERETGVGSAPQVSSAAQGQVPIFGGSCTNGIGLKIVPVTYEYNGVEYADASDSEYYMQDSLTAYKYQAGNYNIMEAVELTLSLSTQAIGTKTNVAVMAAAGTTNDITVEPVGDERDVLLQLAQAVEGGATYGIKNATNFYAPYVYADALYGDKYKWHYIKKGNLYLTLDTIDATASQEDLVYGFRFREVDKLNALPFRFYQPLVGDKINDSFVMEFIVPSYYYYINSLGVWQYTSCHFRPFSNRTAGTDINFGDGATFAGTPTAPVQGGTPNVALGNGKVRFVKFSKQSGPLYVTSDVRNRATRFTFTSPAVGVCAQEFVTVNYLMDNGLYRLPIEARLWDRGSATDLYIAGNVNGAATERAAANAEQLKITLADTIHYYDAVNYTATNIPAGLGAYRWANPATLPAGDQCLRYYGYEPYSYTAAGRSAYNTVRKDVQLFYIQNAAGEYLTVINETAASQNLGQTTNPDVYGTKLAFRPTKYTYTNADYIAGLTDLRPLQMFAIHGCTNVDAPYGEFVLLPAASYVMDYQTKQAIDIDNNVNLGVYNAAGSSIVTGAFRTNTLGYGTLTMIVVPGNSGTNNTITADEFKFTPKKQYTETFCYHNLIKDVDADAYYGADGFYALPDSTKPIMHWSFIPVQGKKALFTLNQELQSWRGVDVVNTTLTGKYYFIEKTAGTYEVINRESPELKSMLTVDVSCLDDLDFAEVCDHAPAAGCYDNFFRFCDRSIASNSFGIIEATYNDRYIWTEDNLSDTPGSVTNALCPQIVGATGQAEYLTIQKSYVRPVSEHHSIPYYNIIRHAAGRDYYLRVYYDNLRNPIDVGFYVPTASELKILQDPENYPTAFPGMKFCFPYRTDENGARMHPDNYKDKTDLYQVFVQTLDTGIISLNMLKATLLKINADSRTLDALQVTEEDILRIDYSAPDKLKATSWFFGDNGAAAYEWVELWGVKNAGANKNTEGWLTSASNGVGNVFVVASGASPVNYGILDAYRDPSSKLTFVFEGDTVIGSYSTRPIWYYRIKNADGKYLTNAVANTSAAYKWSEGKPYAFFGDLLPNDPTNPITADLNYDQTFGLRLVPAEMLPEGATADDFYFWVVSRVDYRVGGYTEYYYLSQINDRLVFTQGDLSNPDEVLKRAMMFQLGGVDANGKYTDVEGVADGAIKAYGLEGAVKVVNATGVIDIYTIDGRKYKSVTATGTEQVIAVPAGVVIVKNNGSVEKVIVK